MKIKLTVNEVLALDEKAKAEGNSDLSISGIASLSDAQPGDLSFLGNPKYKGEVPGSKASVILVPEDFEGSPQNDQLYIRTQNPSFLLAKLCRAIETKLRPKPKPGIHPSAIVEEDVQIDSSASVGPFCTIKSGAKVEAHAVLEAYTYIGRDVRVGESSYLMPRVTVYDYCEVGKECYINSGCVIGSQGFGYETVDGAHQSVPQIGNVIIEDRVDIGANTTIDRARFSSTKIGEGTKIDNLVQIAHNVTIGKHCIIVAQSGISGSSTLENYVVIGGQVGLVGHIKIGTGAKVGAQSGITKDIKPGEFYRGTPAMPYMLAQRVEVLKNRLPDFVERLKKVEKLLESENSISR